MTNAELMKIFNETYPEVAVSDYRPLSLEYIKDKEGITIWTENGDVIQWFPNNMAIEALQGRDTNVPTKDCISRQDAINLLKKWSDGYDYIDTETESAIKDFQHLPSAQLEQQWIPCSERLPEDWVPVLVTLKKPERLPAWIKAKPENYFHIVDADVCENGEWTVNKKNVIAWMPLPEPYQAERRDDETD